MSSSMEADSSDKAKKLIAKWAAAAEQSFWGYIGGEVQTLGDGHTEVFLDIKPHHMNLIGILHGGVYATLIDSAMGLVAMAARPDNAVVTTNLNLNYVSPIKEGRLIVTADIVHESRNMISTQAFARSEDGKLYAFGTGTFRILGA
ncbi:PaaI family thioesterase [Paenibacillus pasadenensis]|uniref:PaaI family thioesterase n=1 Tax=Paenibacillus pasadenensis TaxID=217090 RepID=UPI00203E6F61|nr:PaaI family thioesterase [Paenibacillus pasadenensis]MCM3745799.1 PaaI family thioesterase [Paenibacillus pasadenensis]